MFITEMELLKARLAAGRRLNDSHILKEILQEDRSSEKKRWMAEGERYYRGEHDSLQKDFRRSPISETKDNGEEELRMFFNPNRSNHHCVHPFHHTLVAQKTAYLVGREPTISVRNGDRAFEEMLTELADERFNGVLQSRLAGAANKFYHDVKIISEPDEQKKASYVALMDLTRRVLETCIDLLGFSAPEKM